MPPAAREHAQHQDLTQHVVDAEKHYYVADKATLLRVPNGAMMTKRLLDCGRCVVLPKSCAHKFQSERGTWLVKGGFESITFPKLASFIDEREPCVAIFWRVTERETDPWVVCLRPPLILAGDKVVTDENLSACKLSQIKDFSPIKNESGGSMLVNVNRYLKEGSQLFKLRKTPTVATLISSVQTSTFSANLKMALTHLELLTRKAKSTVRVGDKEPRGQAAQEDQESELARLRDELALINEFKAELAAIAPIFDRPLAQRIVVIASPDGWEAALRRRTLPTTPCHYRLCLFSLAPHSSHERNCLKFCLFPLHAVIIQREMSWSQRSRRTAASRASSTTLFQANACLPRLSSQRWWLLLQLQHRGLRRFRKRGD